MKTARIFSLLAALSLAALASAQADPVYPNCHIWCSGSGPSWEGITSSAWECCAQFEERCQSFGSAAYGDDGPFLQYCPSRN